MDSDRTSSGDRRPVSAGRTRRQLLTGAAAGTAGAIAVGTVLGAAGPAYAGTDGDVVLGQPNTTDGVTLITCTTADVAAFWAAGTGTGPGVRGEAVTGAGVDGEGTPGVYGLTALAGSSGVEGDVIGTVEANGVYGHARNTGASGVYGQNDGTGYGVAGRASSGTGVLGDSQDGTGVFAHTVTGTALQAAADGTGAAVRAESSTGVALHVVGKAIFSRSGLATIKAGSTTVTVHLAGVNHASLILATLHQQAGPIAIASAVPATGSFTIHLTRAPASSLQAAYLVLG